MLSFTIKQGDRRPYLYAVLGPLNEDGEILEDGGQDLTGAMVIFNMKNEKGVVVITGGTVVVDVASEGRVHYAWQAGDTTVAGDFLGEFQATYAGEPESFPNNKIGFKIKIVPQIA